MSYREGLAKDRLMAAEKRIIELERRLSQLLKVLGDPSFRWQPRVAKQTQITSYPADGYDTGGVIFRDGSYSESEAMVAPTYTSRQSTAGHYVHNVREERVPEDAPLTVFRQNGQWWTDYPNVRIVKALINEASGVATTDADFDVDNVSVVCGHTPGSSIAGVKNVLSMEGDNNGVVFCLFNNEANQWECFAMACPA